MQPDSLASAFEHHRAHLRAIAYRMLGSGPEADDALQETWLRLGRTDAASVDNLGGWLTTVTTRVCLDVLRTRATHQRLAPQLVPPADTVPAPDLQLADSLGAALLVVLDTLAPAERVAFVLHDMFDLSFDEIARILDRSESATRQLASRARRRVQRRDASDAGGQARRDVVDAFLDASRGGNLEALLAVLDPDVVVRGDALAVRTAAESRRGGGGFALERELHGAPVVAATFKGSARGAVPVTIDGEPGAAWVVHGEIRAAFVFGLAGGRVRELDIVMEPDALAELAIVPLTSASPRPPGESPR